MLEMGLNTRKGIIFPAGKAALCPVPAVPGLLMPPWLPRDLLGTEQVLSSRKALAGRGSRSPVGPS